MRVEPVVFGRLQSADKQSVGVWLVQRPHPQVQGVIQFGRTNDVGVAESIVRAARHRTNSDIHIVDLPRDPSMADATTAPCHIKELPRLRYAGVMEQKAVGNGNRTFRSPLAPDFTSLGVIPTATSRPVVDVDHVILVLLRS